MIFDVLLKNWPAFSLLFALAFVAAALKAKPRSGPRRSRTKYVSARNPWSWRSRQAEAETLPAEAGAPKSAANPPQKLDIGRWTLELLRALEWKRFEMVCAAYFESVGFATRVARAGADGGVDMHLYENGASSPGIIVQCKAWNTYKVGIKPIRELYGVMSREGVTKGIFVTTGRFTEEARGFLKGDELRLWDGEYLLARFKELPQEKQAALLRTATEGDFTTPSCPSCAIKMVERTAGGSGEAFWGCRNYPRCRQTFKKGALRSPQ